MKVTYSNTVIVSVRKNPWSKNSTERVEQELHTNDPERTLAFLKARRPNAKVVRVVNEPVTVNEDGL